MTKSWRAVIGAGWRLRGGLTPVPPQSIPAEPETEQPLPLPPTPSRPPAATDLARAVAELRALPTGDRKRRAQELLRKLAEPEERTEPPTENASLETARMMLHPAESAHSPIPKFLVAEPGALELKPIRPPIMMPALGGIALLAAVAIPLYWAIPLAAGSGNPEKIAEANFSAEDIAISAPADRDASIVIPELRNSVSIAGAEPIGALGQTIKAQGLPLQSATGADLPIPPPMPAPPSPPRPVVTASRPSGEAGQAAAAKLEPAKAPSNPGASDTPAAPSARAQMSAEDVAALVQRGEALLKIGDVVAARLYFVRAAAEGDAVAAIGAGKTYDPLFLAGMAVHGLAGDPQQAADWYAKASDAGSPEGERRLKALLSAFSSRSAQQASPPPASPIQNGAP